MKGKKVKISTGLFRGYEGTIDNIFEHRGQEMYTVSFMRQLSDGTLSKTTATVKPHEVTLL